MAPRCENMRVVCQAKPVAVGGKTLGDRLFFRAVSVAAGQTGDAVGRGCVLFVVVG